MPAPCRWAEAAALSGVSLGPPRTRGGSGVGAAVQRRQQGSLAEQQHSSGGPARRVRERLLPGAAEPARAGAWSESGVLRPLKTSGGCEL